MREGGETEVEMECVTTFTAKWGGGGGCSDQKLEFGKKGSWNSLQLVV